MPGHLKRPDVWTVGHARATSLWTHSTRSPAREVAVHGREGRSLSTPATASSTWRCTPEPASHAIVAPVATVLDGSRRS